MLLLSLTLRLPFSSLRQSPLRHLALAPPVLREVSSHSGAAALPVPGELPTRSPRDITDRFPSPEPRYFSKSTAARRPYAVSGTGHRGVLGENVLLTSETGRSRSHDTKESEHRRDTHVVFMILFWSTLPTLSFECRGRNSPL